jgi:hypothetical protein
MVVYWAAMMVASMAAQRVAALVDGKVGRTVV